MTPRVLERIYPAPRPTDWYEEWERLYHLDLPHLTEDDLWSERRCVQRRIDHGGKRDVWGGWMRERLGQINAAIRHRQAEARQPQPTGIAWGKSQSPDESHTRRRKPDTANGNRSAIQIPTFTPAGGE